MIKAEKVFIPVRIEERLPTEYKKYFVLDREGIKSFLWFNVDRKRFETNNSNYVAVSYWLEEQQNVIVLTEDELTSLLDDFIKSHYKENPFRKGKNDLKEIDDFLKQKLKQNKT